MYENLNIFPFKSRILWTNNFRAQIWLYYIKVTIEYAWILQRDKTLYTYRLRLIIISETYIRICQTYSIGREGLYKTVSDYYTRDYRSEPTRW